MSDPRIVTNFSSVQLAQHLTSGGNVGTITDTAGRQHTVLVLGEEQMPVIRGMMEKLFHLLSAFFTRSAPRAVRKGETFAALNLQEASSRQKIEELLGTVEEQKTQQSKRAIDLGLKKLGELAQRPQPVKTERTKMITALEETLSYIQDDPQIPTGDFPRFLPDLTVSIQQQNEDGTSKTTVFSPSSYKEKSDQYKKLKAQCDKIEAQLKRSSLDEGSRRTLTEQKQTLEESLKQLYQEKETLGKEYAFVVLRALADTAEEKQRIEQRIEKVNQSTYSLDNALQTELNELKLSGKLPKALRALLTAGAQTTLQPLTLGLQRGSLVISPESIYSAASPDKQIRMDIVRGTEGHPTTFTCTQTGHMAFSSGDLDLQSLVTARFSQSITIESEPDGKATVSCSLSPLTDVRIAEEPLQTRLSKINAEDTKRAERIRHEISSLREFMENLVGTDPIHREKRGAE